MSAGVYFLQCHNPRTNQSKTSLGYYDEIVAGGNEGQIPDIVVDLTTTSQGQIPFEHGTYAVHYIAGFGDFAWIISLDAAGSQHKDGDVVGFAREGPLDAQRLFSIFRDRKRVLFTTQDGFECTVVYRCS